MELFEEIAQLVKEELGISDIVKAVTNDIMATIIKDKKRKPLFKNKRSGVIKDFNLFGKSTTIVYDIYFVKDKSEIDSLGLFNLGSHNGTTNTLKTTLIFVRNENRYIDLEGTLQHEVEHAYQESRSGKPLLTPKNAGIYIKANGLMTSSDQYEKLVGWTLYLANRFEKDGKMNGLYKEIMDNWGKTPIDAVKETNTYRNISAIKSYVNDETSTVKEKIEDVCQKNFNRHYKWWWNIASKVVSAYTNKIGKIIAKVEKDREGDLIDHNGLIAPLKKVNKENES